MFNVDLKKLYRNFLKEQIKVEEIPNSEELCR